MKQSLRYTWRVPTGFRPRGYSLGVRGECVRICKLIFVRSFCLAPPANTCLKSPGRNYVVHPCSGRRCCRVFICNSRWLQILFFNKDYGAGGVAQYPLTGQVFLREATVEDNRLISPSGKPVMSDRTLDYFVAHEITHQHTGAELGPLRFYRLPQWVREGYPDYIGKGPSFRYSDARRAFLAGAPEMEQKKSGLYTRFHLFVAYLLDHQHWSVERLLRMPPAEAAVADASRGEQP